MSMKSKTGVSVIIPTFNRAEFLYTTLLCLCSQKAECEYEIIIIDSGNDKTESLVKMFQNRMQKNIVYKKIKRCRNRSLLRNIGAKISHYSVLCFLDNDILTPPDFIQNHFNEHKNSKNTVLLGCRKGLLYFDITQIGEEAIQTNFNILEQLPYYTDERIKSFNETEPWRFVFSHTLSLERDDYFKTGGFNPDFGEHWGFEDLELGFNLQLFGCKFKLITNQYTFHQPHFEQSNKEQHESSHNAELFIKLHNCYECELCESFYTSFDEFYPILKAVKQDFKVPSVTIQKKYNMIFGCLFSSAENVKYSNMCLGVYSIRKSNSCKKVLIVNEFFRFPQVIQMSILTEAFRIAKTVCIENTNIQSIQEFVIVSKAAGIIVEYTVFNECVEFVQKGKCPGNLFIMLLPDIFQPEKRYVYTWLASHILKKGMFVNLRDIKKTLNVRFDDFCLPQDSQAVIEANFERCFGKTKLQFINSLSMLLMDSGRAIPNNEQTFIIHDEDYVLKYNTLKFRAFENVHHFDESVFVSLSFLSVYEISQKYMESYTNTPVKNSFCCFMENGYIEDGIDIILDAFFMYQKEHKDAKLSIKIPDYNCFSNVVFPLHNTVSKNNKLFSIQQRKTLDLINLETKIKEYKLENNVELIQKNFSIDEVVDFIGTHETYILASRGCSVPPQFYISVILKKHTVIGQHHIILQTLQPLCSIAESAPCEFADEMKVPASCFTIPYLAFRVDSKKLFEALTERTEYISDQSKIEIEKSAYKIIDTYFVKTTFVEGKKREQPDRAVPQ